MRSYPRRRQSNRYIEASDDQQEATQHLTNRDVKSNRIVQAQADNQVSKRTVELEGASNEEGDMLFEKNRDQISRVDKNEYSNNDADANEQSRYYKQYYNAMQAENRELLEDKNRDNARYNLRDRRDVKQANPADTPNVSSQGNKDNIEKTDSEDEESAIKRHIKKLSGDELDQLLNSLTDEKRELLKKIIDDVDAGDNGFINKREITKKAGAVEENNFIENCQSDLSKVQGGSPVADLNTEASPSSNAETTEISKPQEGPTEGNEISSPKSAETSMSSVNKIELTNHIDEGAQNKKTDSNINSFSINLDPKNEGEMIANVQVTTKTENKREANLDDLEGMSFDDSKIENDMNLQGGQDYANDQGYFCSQDDNLSKLLDDDTQVHQDGKPYKRDTYSDKQSDLSESMKSLEESFPNSNAYDDIVPYSGPLVRVKRKNADQVIKKRSAGLLPDAKVAYFPYKAENEDEDNDEGNEFDDEGFYDRTSNFANNNKALEEDAANAENSAQPKNSNADNSKAQHENLESDTMSLGSDTDGVLSGVEGADDNLMYSSGARNRRTAEDNPSDTAEVKSERSPSLLESEKTASENFFNAPHYQENDAFGPLPRNYDGDLARYKRIRRVKQSHNSQEVAPSDG
uniref:EF-hand domain-containing protein n=1 Tax=Heliothis virescens TaxID=7102 RepID=A0A2A4J8K8_HELVI